MDMELRVQRGITTAFINTQPVEITLVERLKEPKPSGGFAWVEEPREPQTFKLVEPHSLPSIITTEDGDQRNVEFILLGEWDAVIGKNDVFRHEGIDWEVVQLYHFNGWERRALVARRG